MKLSPYMQFNLTRLNSALIRGDENALMECLQAVPLGELLSQDTVLKVRARGKTSMALFLCTLAVANEVEPERAQVWLDCYQSVANRELRGGLLKHSDHNVLRKAVEALTRGTALAAAELKGTKGSTQHWKDAVELLIDHKDWESAVTLLTHLGKKPADTACWLQIARSLAQRHVLYVDESSIAQPDVDYLRLARLHELCVQAARNAKASDIVRSMSLLQASCLEVAGHQDDAIALLRQLDKTGKSTQINLDIARSLCKKGDLPAAIAQVDEALKHYKLDVPEPVATALVESRAEPAADPVKSFNVGNASKALSDLARIFKQHDLKLFLVSGTLLGYEREGKLLDHDKDIDIGVIGWENQYDICMALQSSGLFTISTQFLKGNNSYYIPVMHHLTGMWIDIFIYYPQGDKWVTGVDFFFGYRQTFAFTPFELKPVNFLGVDMYVPEDTDLNLQENFGNWRVPDASYISHLESPSTMNKGGHEHLLTARMNALNAMVKKQPRKLRKVIEVAQSYSDRPCAFPPEVLDHLRAQCGRLESAAAQAQSAPPVIQECDFA